MALYYPPVKPNSPIFSYQNFAIPNTPVSPAQTGGITEEYLATHYLAFPNAQGVENFGFKELNLNSSNVGETATLYINPNAFQDVVLETAQTSGSLTIQTSATTNNTMILSPSTGITFGDGTVQSTANNDINAVQTNQPNIFLSPFLQTFNGPTTYGADVNFGNNDLTNIGSIAGNTISSAITVNSQLQFSTGNDLNLLGNDISQIGTLYIGDNSGFNYSTMNQTASPNQLTIYNSGPNSSNTSNIAFNLKNSSGTQFNTMQIFPNTINLNVPINMNSGNGININNESLYLYSGTEYSSFNQNSALNQLTIYNNAPHSDNSANISFNLNIPTNSINVPVNILQLSPNEVDIKTTLNMNNNNINNINTLNAGGVGGFVQTNTPLNNNTPNAIATTQYVQTAISGGVAGAAILNPQPTVTQTFTGAISFSVNPVSTAALPAWGTNTTALATTQFVQSALPKYTSTTMSNWQYGPTLATLINPSYPAQTELISTSSQYSSVSFFDNPFSYTNVNVAGVPVGTQYVFTNAIIVLQFSASPWVNFPPSQLTDTMIGTTQTGLTVAIPIGWSLLGNYYLLYIGNSYSAPNGTSITTSLSSLGIFPA